MNRKIIYTAGPITTDSQDERFRFHMEARTMARKIWATGHICLCPHLNTMFMDGPDIPSSNWYRGDEEMIRRCVDAMIMLPGWSRSTGSCTERALAQQLNLPVFYYDEQEIFWEYLGVENATH